MIAPIAPIAPRRVVISVAMRRSREGRGKKKGLYKTIEEDEKTRTCILKRRKKLEEKEERRERDESRKREKGRTCRSLVDDDPAWPVPNRSFERNIEIKNVSVSALSLLLPGRCRCVPVCALVVTVVWFRVTRYWTRCTRGKYTAACTRMRVNTNWFRKRSGLHRTSLLIADAVVASVWKARWLRKDRLWVNWKFARANSCRKRFWL